MHKVINIKWHNESLQERSRIEQLISAWLDFAYGYNIDNDRAVEDICEILDDLDIEYEVTEEPDED